MRLSFEERSSRDEREKIKKSIAGFLRETEIETDRQTDERSFSFIGLRLVLTY